MESCSGKPDREEWTGQPPEVARRGKEDRPPAAQILEKLLPSVAGWEPGRLGEAVLLAVEQVSGLQALWELAGRARRQGAGPASERAGGRCLR